ncbi:MAG: hypothetical protein ACOY0T_33010 [Myxococcota bacterium]
MKPSSLFAALVVCLSSSLAQAHPQWNTGLLGAGCLVGDDDTWFDHAAFCGAAQADLILLRERTSDFGFGPYASVGTTAFSDLRLSLGARALFPIIEDFPLVASAGGVLRDGREPGVEASLFWGPRSFNFHGSYNLAGGVVLSGTHLFDGPRSNVLALGVQLDGFILAVPWLLLWGALK